MKYKHRKIVTNVPQILYQQDIDCQTHVFSTLLHCMLETNKLNKADFEGFSLRKIPSINSFGCFDFIFEWGYLEDGETEVAE